MDMEQLMAQARELQDKVSAAQDELGRTKVKGIADAGACIVEMTCKYDVVSVAVREDATARGASYVSKIVLDAMRDAKAKADTVIDRVMGDATAGMPMPE